MIVPKDWPAHHINTGITLAMSRGERTSRVLFIKNLTGDSISYT